MDGSDLTQRQRAILDFIVASVEQRGYPPAVREIGQAVGLASPSTVHAHLQTLEDRGYLRRDPTKPRAIEAAPSPPARPRSPSRSRKERSPSRRTLSTTPPTSCSG